MNFLISTAIFWIEKVFGKSAAISSASVSISLRGRCRGDLRHALGDVVVVDGLRNVVGLGRVRNRAGIISSVTSSRCGLRRSSSGTPMLGRRPRGQRCG